MRVDIDGLEFPETQDRVKNQLEGIVGVKCVELSTGKDYLEVSFDDQTSEAEINNHLQNNGYKVTDRDRLS
jgi:copper chaperone CopZ